jgi:hypothetical protein
MFLDRDLINHVQTKNSISVDSLVIAEINQNDLPNLDDFGNYRFRPDGSDVVYRTIYPIYDPSDSTDSFTGALESSYISQYRTENPNEPLTFVTKETNRELYFSLKDCIKPFRPRSGINKIVYFGTENIDNEQFVDSIRSGSRPRYYFCSRFDKFKYWNSFRNENNKEFGISSTSPTFFTPGDPSYKIEDCAPFFTYKNEVATNRIVVKMQTNLGDPAGRGMDGQRLVERNIRKSNKSIPDPLENIKKSSIPRRWKIQYLDSSNRWNDAISFNENSVRKNGSRIVDWHGHVEIYYGIKIPEMFKQSFNLYRSLQSVDQLPDLAREGDAYLIGSSTTNPGTLYVYSQDEQEFLTFDAEYGFSLLEDDDTKRIGLIKKVSNPDYFDIEGVTTYRDFIFIKGIRVVVETMFAPNRSFDLIEVSPRLKIDITDYVLDYDISKNIMATDFGLPVGGLVASTGGINLSNHDAVFTELNLFNPVTKTGSIIANNLKPQIKFDFYESVLDVNGFDKFIPLKTFFSENAAVATSGMQDVSLTLRDAYFILESNKATPIFLQNCTLTMAVALLLDGIGFSNYVFKNINTANDPVIPFFFVEPDVSVAEVLQRIAKSTQSAMFFDEYNNFVVMPKEYLMPEVSVRNDNPSISERLITLYGQKTGNIVPNIETISGFETKVLNDGQINYTTRYIQREVSRLEQASLSLSERTYGYKSAVLWELGNQEESRTINQPTAQVGYALGAVPLNTGLGSAAPFVENHEIKNNTIDVGESAFWLPKFQGYLYANGEIIRYDAQQFIVDSPSASATNGIVWISDNNEYQKYFSTLRFNGKMILTGLLRIYTEPFYENASGSNFEDLEENVRYKNGEVRSHGRGQFGTSIVSHSAGLNEYWSNIENRKSFRMDSENIYSNISIENLIVPELSSASVSTPLGNDSKSRQNSSVHSRIANFMKQSTRSEGFSSYSNLNENGQQNVAGIQSSALILNGPYPVEQPNVPPDENLNSSTAKDLVTYIHKDLTSDYRHVGTRLRIIGKKINDKKQESSNAMELFDLPNPVGEASTSKLFGGAGGIGYMTDPNTNSGYYLEIASLSEDIFSFYGSTGVGANVSGSVSLDTVIENIIFYKVEKTPYKTQIAGKQNIAVPRKLFGSLARILVDEGKFIGSDRLTSQEIPVYDLSLDAQIFKDGERISKIKFSIYLNNSFIGSVTDETPLQMPESGLKTCLFTRGSSKIMFENIYAMKNSAQVGASISERINEGVSAESLRKYSLPLAIQRTYVSSINTESRPTVDFYFEEFGTILRECAYFNIKYDQAYPALIAKLVPSFTSEKSYEVSGFLAGSYGAEFLLFNVTDKAISLSESSTNRVMIQGITFTQNISNVLTVDDYFKELSNYSDPVITSSNLIVSPGRSEKTYDNIRNSRTVYGNKSFSIDSVYIQNEDSAKDIMKWVLDKTIRPRKVFEFDTFGTAHIQLGDVVNIDFDLPEGVKLVDNTKKFVVISAQYGRSSSNVKSQLRVMEV